MYKLLCYIFLLAVSQFANSAVTFEQANVIFNKLIAANHITSNPRLILVKGPAIQAAASGNKVYIWTGMLAFAKNDDEIARTLGHELGHSQLHHWRSSIPNEYAADQAAIIYLQAAGYNKCVAAQLLLRRNSDGGSDHPSDHDRYDRFNCP